MATKLAHRSISDEYDVTVAERAGSPGAWNVEAIDSDGGIEQAIFAGPISEERAKEYAAQRYDA